MISCFSTDHSLKGKKLLIQNKTNIYFIDLEDILLIKRVERKSCLVCKNAVYESWQPLKDIIAHLPSRYYFQSHKSYIVNMIHIEEIELQAACTYNINFKDSTVKALLSKSNYPKLMAHLTLKDSQG
ncbi:hypothetical protein HMPREF3291_00840 [Bacillus sp. HMSC76G11]|nr:hypothetical protein HMPREF3291_00840 [Bacillus sp. HMSC76G11]